MTKGEMLQKTATVST